MVFQVIGSVLAPLSDLASIGMDASYAAQSANVATADDYVRGANAPVDASHIHRDYAGASTTPYIAAAAPVASSSSLSVSSSVCMLMLLLLLI